MVAEVDFVVVVVSGAEVGLGSVWVFVVWIVENVEVEEAVVISTMEVVDVIDVDFVQDAVVIWTIVEVEVVS